MGKGRNCGKTLTFGLCPPSAQSGKLEGEVRVGTKQEQVGSKEYYLNLPGTKEAVATYPVNLLLTFLICSASPPSPSSLLSSAVFLSIFSSNSPAANHSSFFWLELSGSIFQSRETTQEGRPGIFVAVSSGFLYSD